MHTKHRGHKYDNFLIDFYIPLTFSTEYWEEKGYTILLWV